MQAHPDDLVVLIAGHHAAGNPAPVWRLAHRGVGAGTGRLKTTTVDDALLELAVEQGLAQRNCDARLRDDARDPRLDLVIERLGRGDTVERRTRHRRRRSRTPGPPAMPTRPNSPSARKAVFGPDRPPSSTSASYVRTHHARKLTPELRNLYPNRTVITFRPANTSSFFIIIILLSRPVEDCEECPALAGVRNLGLDDPSADRPIKHCNFGDRSIQVLPRLQHVEGRDGYLRSVHRAAAPASGSCSPARWADR